MQTNPMQMIQQFKEFSRQFQGNPEQEVRKLMQEGKMSQAQFNQLQQMATQFQQMMGNLKM